MQKVFVIGGTTFDHIITLPALPQPIPQTIHTAPFHEAVGSTGTGKAVSLTKLDVPVKFYSCFGNDVFGEAIINYLNQQKVRFFYDIDPAGTERHVNLMDKDGNRISLFVTQSSENLTQNTEAIKEAINWADCIVLNIIGYCKQLAPLVANSNKPIWTDLHDYDGINAYHQVFINAAQFIHLSSDNLPNYKPIMQQFIDQGKKLVVCTHGKKGATALDETGQWYEQAALTNYPYVDGNGAGDSFFSGFLKGWLQQFPIQTCMQMGAVTAALTVGSQQIVAENLSYSNLLLEMEKNRYQL